LIHLLPLAALLRLEVITLLRHKGIFAFVTIATALVVAGIFATVTTLTSRDMELQNLSTLCLGLFITCGLSVLFASVLSIPSLAGSSIVLDLQKETLEFLALTYVRPIHLVLAKLLASVSVTLLFIVSLMPIVALTYFGVGIDAGHVMEIAAVAVVSAFAYSAVSIYVSARKRTVLSAVFVSFIATTCLFGAPFILLTLFLEFVSINGVFADWPLMIGVNFSPLLFFMSRTGGMPSISLLWGPFSTLLLFQASMAVAFTVLAVITLRRKWGRPRHDATTSVPRKSLFTRRAIPRPDLVFPDWPGPMTSVDSQLRLSLSGRMRLTLLILPPLALMFACTTVGASSTQSYETVAIIAGTLIVCAPLLVPLFLATSINSEIENGTFEGIRMTLQTPRRVALCKIYTAAHVIALIAVPLLIVFTLYVMLVSIANPGYRGEWLAIVCTSESLLVCLATAAVVSLAASSLLRSQGAALALSYAVLAWFGIGQILAVLSFFELTRSNVPERVLYFLSPMIALVENLWRDHGTVARETNHVNWQLSLFVLMSATVVLYFVFYFRVRHLMLAEKTREELLRPYEAFKARLTTARKSLFTAPQHR
jgi:ABC-type transport system involved in multi-copper enzyme maturation permease subunit